MSLKDLILNVWSKENVRDEIKERCSERKLHFYFKQVNDVLQSLHDNKIYYGDIKPDNLLVFRD